MLLSKPCCFLFLYSVLFSRKLKELTKGIPLQTNWHLKDILRLPKEGRLEFAEVLQQAAAAGTWPWQLLRVIAALLAKKTADAGDRVIGLLAMTTRIWSKIRGSEVPAWSRKLGDF